jgi:hypothetical protein
VYSQARGRTVAALFGGALIVFAFAVAAGFASSQTSGHKVFSRAWFFMFAFASGQHRVQRGLQLTAARLRSAEKSRWPCRVRFAGAASFA